MPEKADVETQRVRMKCSQFFSVLYTCMKHSVLLVILRVDFRCLEKQTLGIFLIHGTVTKRDFLSRD